MCFIDTRLCLCASCEVELERVGPEIFEADMIGQKSGVLHVCLDAQV